MAQSYSIKASIGSGRQKVIDVVLNQSLIISLLTTSCSANNPEWEFYFDRDIADLIIPNQPTLTLNTASGVIPRNTKVYVRVSSVDANGLETAASSGGKFTTTGSGTDSNRVIATWAAVTGAVSYNVYAGTHSGREAFVINTTTLTWNIDDFPDPNGQKPQIRDISLLSKGSGMDPIPFGGQGFTVSGRIIVYCNVSTAAEISVAILGS